jgi:hypothetical protein
MKDSSKTTRDKLKELEANNERICEDIAVYQNICIDELCEDYANILSEATDDIDKDNALSLLNSLAKEIYKVYFN